jgi:hypothetical protein
MKYTVKFFFPLGVAYPGIGGGFMPEINKNTRFWADYDTAEVFAEEMAGKYGYDIIEIEEPKKKKKKERK